MMRLLFTLRRTIDQHRKYENMDLDSRVKVSVLQLSCECCDRVSILNRRSGSFYHLDSVAALVWGLVQKKDLAVHEIIDAVLAEYEVSRSRCENDILLLLENLELEGLIETVP